MLLIGQIILMGVAKAEVKSYEGEGEYVMSDFETPDVAKQRAKVRAQRDAQEKAGVFVNSFTKVNNYEVTEDEVIVITSGIMSITETKYEHEAVADGFLYRAKIKANIDTDEINKWLEKGIQERSTIAAQAKELQASIEAQNKEIAELKRKLNEKNSQEQKEKIRTEIVANDQAFLANQKVETGNKLYFVGDWCGAIANYDKAISLNPSSDIAYRNRGTTYANIDDYSSAVADFSRAIEISPTNAASYIGRGAAYIYLKDYIRALADLNKAIELNPSDGMAYYNRGICHQALGDMTSARIDFDKAKNMGVS